MEEDSFKVMKTAKETLLDDQVTEQWKQVACDEMM